MLSRVPVDPSVLTSEQRIELLHQAFEEAWPDPPEGWLLVGGPEVEHSWQATVDAFAGGIWVATILCAQAVAERVLAGMLALQELPGRAGNPPKGWEGWGMGKLLAHVREQGWIPDDLIAALDHLCEARKHWGHWKRPFHPGSLREQAVRTVLGQLVEEDVDAVHERLLSQEAHRGAVTAMRLYFGNYGRGPYEV